MIAKTKIRRKQAVIFVTGLGGLVGIVFLGLYLGDNPPARAASDRTKKLILNYAMRPSSAVSPEEIWMSRSEMEITTLQRDNRELREQLEQLKRTLSEWKDVAHLRVAQAEVPPPPSWAQAPAPAPAPPTTTRKARATNPFGASVATSSSGGYLPTSGSRPTRAQQTPTQQSDQRRKKTIRHISLSLGEEKSSKKKAAKTIKHYLPPGSIATATLLSGLDAPTGGLAQTNPMPVLLRIMDSGKLPNYVRSDLKHCHAVGAAYGDISSERAMIRLEKLSCVLVSGEVVEGELNGYVAGEDGKNGFRGNLVSKQGAMIAKALVAGLASGVSTAVSQQYRSVATTALGTVSTLDPQRVAEVGLATGATNALEKIADYYIQRANETYPIIEIAAARVGELILTSGTDLELEFVGKTQQEPLYGALED